ncbi:GMC family oxidoreductase N-terminal domain-containing protein [Sulfitobacter mediterraneus]|nr:GMC family oxidoreductase N-terminal domain-containing protein [Sulfitobacter mediterraneus]MBM1634378.1 GMC family oxidoreductase N-terminal domain-containing protein [Sulfitobacter mediterraneus]MBM1642195.1 GMC family oxidoreductase N-terminal domain-containing protein [Sulfitobacter mediterraneus]MBM1646244.1 GMC family oxidoreductase N-terminal domain-containing protein [Sulfitobacter mediterraneus]MBM1650290.1 GMC family oxidoreductase N-terminal domain-containing protein [Sulfitobacte
MIEADYVIIGGGTAGCVLAHRLSENGAHRVLVIEAGSARRSPWVDIPAGFQKLLVSHRHNWRFVTEPEATTGHRAIAIPRGRGLGGSSLINGMIWVRGQPEDYNAWSEMGCDGWSWQAIQPYFERVDGIGLRHNSTGTGGMIPVAETEERPYIAELFLKAGHAAGLPQNPNYNAGEQEGVCTYQVNQQHGQRVSAWHAYLAPALRRANLEVLTDASVERITIDKARATGVIFRRGREVCQVRARREVIVAAGAVQSPQLLELSGVGESPRLQALGIDPLVHNPHVGEHYADHFCTRLSWEVRGASTLNQQTRGLGLAAAVLRYTLTRKGILTLGTGLAGAFLRAVPEAERPDVQLFFMHASYANAAERILDRHPGITLAVSQLRPKSRGSIHAVSSDPKVPPAIRANMLSHPEDLRVMIEGMRRARDIVNTAPLAQHCVRETAPGPDCHTDAEWEAFARETGQTIYHASGTCRMGREGESVTDPALRVRGVDGLRVIDASVMPAIPSGNTQAAVFALAEKGADLVLDDAR